MKYINREYGFTFRPPFFDKFYEESKVGPPLKEDSFPRKYIIGMGYDYSAINGAMFIGKNGSMWGIKVSYYDGRKWLDNDDFILNMGSGCANTPDGSFAHFSSGPLSVKWAKRTEQALAVEISARKKLKVRVICYPCCDWPADLSIEGSYVKGRSPYVGIVPGTISLSESNAVFKGRYKVICDDSAEREYFIAQSYSKPTDSANGAFNESIMEFVINKNQPKVYLYAMVGDEGVFAVDVPREDKIAKLIETYELRYGVNKTGGSGFLGSGIESMFNSVMWSKIYYPYLLETIYSPKRSSLNPHFDILGIEENCAALLGSYIGDGKMAETQLKYTFEDKVMSLISAWQIYIRLNDKDKLADLYKKYSELYPPESDRLVVTSDESKGEVAYKWTDSPLRELNKPTAMYSLDLSCFKLLAFDILERIAVIFEMPEADMYAQSKKKMIGLINEVFWNEASGMYINRYVTGQWAVNYGATSFYPLLAGAVDSISKLSSMINNLTNPGKFFGDYVVPTLAKDSKFYGKKGRPNNNGFRSRPYLEYRGSIVPYVNYIIYHGLRRYGIDEIAGEFAYRSVKLWQNSDSSNVENYSMYLPNGKRVKKKDYLSNNGNMLALMGLQELIDVEYFRSDMLPALRFGTFVKGSHSVSNLKLLNRSYSVDVNNFTTILLINNENVFTAEGGRCIIRNYLETKNGCEFMIDAHSIINITLRLLHTGKAKTKIFLVVPVGKSKIVVDNEMVNIQVIE